MFSEETASPGERTASVVPATRGRKRRDARPSKQRSAVTNGARLFVAGDGCSAWSRRFGDLVTLHADDLGGGDVLSAAQDSLIRRVATMEVELERMEGQLSEGAEIDLDIYTRTAGHLRRHLEALGIERRQRDVTPSPEAYLAGLAAEKARRAAADSETADEPSAGEKTRHGPAVSLDGPVSAGASAA